MKQLPRVLSRSHWAAVRSCLSSLSGSLSACLVWIYFEAGTLKTFGGWKRIYTRRIFDLLWHRKRWSVRRRFVMWCLILCFRTSLWWKQYPAHWYTVSIILDKTFIRPLPETTLILKFNHFLLAREEKYR